MSTDPKQQLHEWQCRFCGNTVRGLPVEPGQGHTVKGSAIPCDRCAEQQLHASMAGLTAKQPCDHDWQSHPQPIPMLRATGWKCAKCQAGTLTRPRTWVVIHPHDEAPVPDLRRSY